MKAIHAVVLAVTLAFASLAALAAGPVDINTADAAALSQNLKGVGPKTAQAIVEYRKQHGPFKSVDELTRVKGIGPKLLERNREQLRAGAPAK